VLVRQFPTPEQSSVAKDSESSPAPQRTSNKQIEANRRNAVNSTGPRTAEGKQASRLNALTHGLRAKEIVIPGLEDPAEFEAILTELYEEWEPEGYTELHLVEQIAVAIWRLRRGNRAELGHIRKQMNDLEARIYSKTELEIARQRLSIPQGFELQQIQRYEAAIRRDMYKAIDQLERRQRRRKGEPQPPTVNVNVAHDDGD